MTTLDEHVMNVRSWYRRHIPNPNSPAFAGFFGGAYRFLEMTCAPNTINSITLHTEVHTASCEVASRNIILPARALFAPYYKNFHLDLTPDILPEVVAGVMTGLGIHEAAHLRYTLNLQSAHVKSKTRLSKVTIKWQTIFHTLHNIVEDWYIDNQTMQESYGMFTEMLLDVFFSESVQEINVNNFHDATSGTLLRAVTTLLIGAKHPAFRTHRIWDHPTLDQFMPLLDKVLKEHSFHKRVDLAIDLYFMLLELVKDQPDDGAGVSNLFNDELASDPEHNILPNGHYSLAEDDLSLSERRFVREIQRQLETRDLPSQSARKPVLERDVMAGDVERYKEKLLDGPSKVFTTVGRILSRLQHVNNPPIIPRPYGGAILKNRVANIATDGKIFGRRMRIKDNSDREVIILVDMSGSMRYKGLIKNALEAAWGAFNGLRSSRTRAAVYGHTSGDYRIRDQPLLLRIVSYGLVDGNTSQNDARFLRAAEVEKSNNFDGLAIERVAKKFTKRQCPKMLIVLSDGQPQGSGYSGDDAVDHTRQVVNKVRKQGIRVVSLSLIPQVMVSNNDIYGERWNIDASTDLENKLKRLVMNLD